jgi:hypothetical protein
VAYTLLAAFRQVYNENQVQKAEWKNLKNLQFIQKRKKFKVVSKNMVFKEISAIKRKSRVRSAYFSDSTLVYWE